LQRANENKRLLPIKPLFSFMGQTAFSPIPFCTQCGIIRIVYQYSFCENCIVDLIFCIKTSLIQNIKYNIPIRKGAIFIAIYHCSIKIISRGKGKSAVAAAAYRSGEKLTNQYDGIVHDYTRKSGIAYTEILLPSHAPPEFSDRSTLWNSVEKIEKAKNSQLAREIEIAIPKELSDEQQIELVRQYVNDNFVSVGMCADFAIHDKKDGNPHAHIMLTMRPLEQDGTWGAKSKKEYIVDDNGERVKLKSGKYKTRKINTVDWNEQDKAELWRSEWAKIANKFLEQNSIDERIDHRSFERQGIEQIPTIHLGTAASQMEHKGIETERGNINREIKAKNKILAEIKDKIASLKNWLADLFKQKEKHKPDNIIELLLKMKDNKCTRWQKINSLHDISVAIVYLQNHNIITKAELDEQFEKVSVAYDEVRATQADISAQLKDKKELYRQGEIYIKYRPVYEKYKSQKPRKQERFYEDNRTELALYDYAVRYLKQHYTGTALPMKQWDKEIEELAIKKFNVAAENKSLSEEYNLLLTIKSNVERMIKPQSQERQHRQKRNIEYER
jgi:hypothetical protein